MLAGRKLLWNAMHLDSLTTGKARFYPLPDSGPHRVCWVVETSWGPRRVEIFPWYLHKLQPLVVSCRSRYEIRFSFGLLSYRIREASRGGYTTAVRPTKESISSGPTLLKAVLSAVRGYEVVQRYISDLGAGKQHAVTQSRISIDGSSRSVPRFGPTCHFDW